MTLAAEPAARGAVALCALVAMTASGLSYQLGKQPGRHRPHTVLLLKGGTTMIAALLALYGAGLSGLPGHWWLFLGLVVCAAADVLLDMRFRLGMAAFALGHLCYITAFVLLAPVQPISVAAYAALALVVLLMGRYLGRGMQEPVLPFQLYGLVISAMLALALGLRPLTAVGAVLFVVSDSLIFYRFLRPAGRLNDAACILLYYTAQYLLALSTLYT